MARILNVEKPQYINQVIDIYTKNKIGQYSKFLDKQPTYVTYYHINEAMSRADVGTGNIESEYGARSPIRFNKIKNFPIYNIPELRPDVNYDETGYDIDLNCNDLVILPNTIRPKSGDYFIVDLPGSREYLFRVNNFQYNTIQANDYYLIDADVKNIGRNLEDKMLTGQVVETYLTVFENIGTQDKCFIRTTDVDYLNGLADLYYKLRDFYKNAFYIRDLNAFTYQTGKWSEFGTSIYRYDMYLESFINKSNIYYDENSEESLVLTPADVVDSSFNFSYDMTLYNAILEHSLELLRPYCYMTTDIITMRYSIFNMMGYTAESVTLYPYNSPLGNSSGSSTTCSCGCGCTTASSDDNWYDLDPMPKCTPTWSLEDGVQYFGADFLNSLLNGKLTSDDYCELIIFNYMYDISMKIDRKKIMQHIDKNEHTYYYLPMIIYIIGTMYRKYFVSENEIDD